MGLGLGFCYGNYILLNIMCIHPAIYNIIQVRPIWVTQRIYLSLYVSRNLIDGIFLFCNKSTVLF